MATSPTKKVFTRRDAHDLAHELMGYSRGLRDDIIHSVEDILGTVYNPKINAHLVLYNELEREQLKTIAIGKGVSEKHFEMGWKAYLDD